MDELNEKQIEAVKTTEGYLRVIAGAGSGKTRMLVARYIYILKELGINANNIICLTFSNKTASEMKKRIKAILGDDDLSFVTTYHGLGARIIRDNTHLMFFASSFQIIDRSDQKQIFGEIYEELEMKLDSGTFEDIIEKMEIFKDDLKYIKYMVDTKTSEVEYPTYDTKQEVIRRYLTRQKKHFLVDFADLINYSVYILEKYESVRTKWQNQLNYILVDEFQDSTSKEVRLINLLSGQYENLMVVGDPDQNIYEWRGSQMKYLVDFEKSHIPTQTIIMNQNYRSTPKILKCANQLISYNKNRYPKDLFTNNNEGEDVIYYQGDNDYKEAEWIINKIKLLHDSFEQSYSNIAILYRASYLSRVIEAKLNESAIPYEIIGNMKFFQRMEIKDIIAYMKLCFYDDDYSLKRIINVPKRQFGKMKMQLLQNLRNSDESLYQTLKENIDRFSSQRVKEFIQLIEDTRQLVKETTVLNVFEELLTKSGYERYIRELGSEERLENLTELRRVIQGLLVDDDSINLGEVLSYFALQSDYETEDRDKVKLMTVHAAKGLEFTNVFVVGLNEGTFPSKKTIDERGLVGLEEERRLCYVALTRAKERLFLTSPNSFATEGDSKMSSRFLTEIGEENYVSINVKSKKDKEKEEKAIKHKVLDNVTHRIFGKGVIVDIDLNFKSYKVLFEKSKFPRNVDFSFEFEEDKVEENNNSNEEKENTDDKRFEEVFSKKQIDLLEKRNKERQQTITLEETKEEDKQEENKQEENKDNQVYTKMFIDLDKVSLKEEDLVRPITEDEVKTLNSDPNLPITNWKCIGISDLGYPKGICMLCGQQEIRYMHHMKHDLYPRILSVGCICAGKMENDSLKAESRENNFKNRLNRRLTFLKKEWKTSTKGNSYIKYCNHNITIFKTKENKYVAYIDNIKMEDTYNNKDELLNKIFDIIDED